MAGRGKEPKNPEERRRRNVPTRGEWVDLPKSNPEKPPAPANDWHPHTKTAWNSWWADPASLMWGPADQDTVRELARLHDRMESMEGTRGLSSMASEVRQRKDGLGLSEKGKRDLRWRVVSDEVAEKRKEAATRESPYDRVSLYRGEEVART